MGIKLWDDKTAQSFGSEVLEAVAEIANKHNVMAQVAKSSAFQPDQFNLNLEFIAYGDMDLNDPKTYEDAEDFGKIIPFPSEEERKRMIR